MILRHRGFKLPEASERAEADKQGEQTREGKQTGKEEVCVPWHNERINVPSTGM